MEVEGWILDVYIKSPDLAIIWLKDEDGRTIRIVDSYTPSFYIKPNGWIEEWELRCLLSDSGLISSLCKEEKYISLRSKKKDSLIKVEVPSIKEYNQVVKRIKRSRLAEAVYDADLRHVQKYLFTKLGIEPTSKVKLGYDGEKLLWISKVDDEKELPFSLARLEYELEHGEIKRMKYIDSSEVYDIECDKEKSEAAAQLYSIFKERDPDIIVLPKCDRIAFPLLKSILDSAKVNIARYNDEEQVKAQGSWGGRIFIEESMIGYPVELWGIAGMVERARFSFLPLGLAARWLSNRCIDSRNCYELIKRGYAIPEQEYYEPVRDLEDLLERDRGGISITPISGIAHHNVAALDFDSQYPNIILKGNLSYEKAGDEDNNADDERGLISIVIEPWLKKRLELKKIKKLLAAGSKERILCEQRIDALKLMLVCVTPDTKILLEDHYISIEELESGWKGKKVLSVNDEMELTSSEITDYIKLQSEFDFEAFKIVTESGNSITATSDHKFLTPSGWMKLEELKSGDKVAICKIQHDDSNTASLKISLKKEKVIVWERIRSKEAVKGIKDVRDLVVQPHHSFIANGFVSHNCQYGISGCCWNRFGNVLTFEEINRRSREAMIEAKRIVEDKGFEIIYSDVDSLFVKREDAKREDYEQLADIIAERTSLPMSLDKHFRFIAFPKLKGDYSSSALKRYFGVTYDGEVEARGIEMRRDDIPALVRDFQRELILCLMKYDTYEELYGRGVKEAKLFLDNAVKRVQEGIVDKDSLFIEKTMRKEPQHYKKRTAHLSAAEQILGRGGIIEAGEKVRYIITDEDNSNMLCRVNIEPRDYDRQAYCKMLIEAAKVIFESIGVDMKSIKDANTTLLDYLAV